MKKYKLIIFDLDGTLADTSPGIKECYKFANKQMGRQEPTDDDLEGVIGASLLATFMTHFNFLEEDARKAVQIYREHYKETGYLGSELYQGMKETLCMLKKKGFLLGVATLKAEPLAKQIFEKFGILNLFDVVHGVDAKDTLSKSDLINLCLKELKCSNNEAVLVGDSKHDGNGAKLSKVDFIAVTYGFGFKDREELEEAKPVSLINKPSDLLDIV